jgi:hypothetical protein
VWVPAALDQKWNGGAARASGIDISDSADWDYNGKNGLRFGAVDFEHTLTHESLHVLGFQSTAAEEAGSSILFVWDLFRLDNALGTVSPSEFAGEPRMLETGVEALAVTQLNFPTNQFRLSTGEDGDGNQSGHWKDDNLFGDFIGVMDPTQGPGSVEIIGAYLAIPDVRALDFIGYDLDSTNQPQLPTTVTLLTPPNESVGVEVTPTLAWDEGAFTDTMSLYVFKGADGNEAFQVFEAEDLTVEMMALPQGTLIPETSYSWRVTSQNLSGFTLSDVFSFETAGCAGDFNGDGMANVLDFVAFQLAFEEMNPNADCNTDGTYDIIDFVCFQTAFNGCP